MSEFRSLRSELQTRLAALKGRVSKIEGDLKKRAHPDSEERATERENDEVLEGLSTQERSEISQIETALQRIDAGTYGECESCGAKIDPKRLKALPYAIHCIQCAS